MTSLDGLDAQRVDHRHSYQVINSGLMFITALVSSNLKTFSDLIRVIRKGTAVKNTVDDAIDLCAEVLNLRDAIENARARAEQATDERQKRLHAQKGCSSEVLWYSSVLMNF